MLANVCIAQAAFLQSCYCSIATFQHSTGDSHILLTWHFDIVNFVLQRVLCNICHLGEWLHKDCGTECKNFCDDLFVFIQPFESLHHICYLSPCQSEFSTASDLCVSLTSHEINCVNLTENNGITVFVVTALNLHRCQAIARGPPTHEGPP